MKFNCLSFKIDYDDLTIFDHAQFRSGQNISPSNLSMKWIELIIMPIAIFLIGYCGHPNFPYKNIQLGKAINLLLAHFQKEDHSFINDTLRNRNTQLVYLYYVNKT